MPSSTPIDLSRSKNPTTEARPRMSMANQNLESPAILQRIESQPASTKTVEKIRTFLIWSIFNLLLLPFGILCCYFSHRVSQYKVQNRYELANKWSKRTFVINIITTLIMFGIIITTVMLRYDYKQRNTDNGFNVTRTTGIFIPWQPGR